MSSDYKKAVDCIINNRRRKIDVGTCYYYDGEKHLTRKTGWQPVQAAIRRMG